MSTTMANISAAQVKELREKTGAPMMDCKQALTEAKGDMEQAIVVLRKKGVSVAAKKAARVTSEGSVATTFTPAARLACWSRSTAKAISWRAPKTSRSWSTTSPCTLRQAIRSLSGKKTSRRKPSRARKTFISLRPIASGKPAHIVEKMVAGKMEKFYEEVCLLEQPFIKDQTISISQLIAAKVGKLGENIAVRRFARFKVGDATATVAFVSTKPDSRPDEGGEASAPAAK